MCVFAYHTLLIYVQRARQRSVCFGRRGLVPLYGSRSTVPVLVLVRSCVRIRLYRPRYRQFLPGSLLTCVSRGTSSYIMPPLTVALCGFVAYTCFFRAAGVGFVSCSKLSAYLICSGLYSREPTLTPTPPCSRLQVVIWRSLLLSMYVLASPSVSVVKVLALLTAAGMRPL